ncbi:MAG TPA: Maf family protein [Candidatus Rifleibacterium sp.]|nr:Maf family protein [Candidatus Rifleibacterium sp.]HPT47382.1 Maf family protein [Candidatus Rifleibacterium sp.]
MLLPPLYLASKSPRRQEILTGLKIPFKILDSPYEEKFSDVAELEPEEQASKLAGLKAFHAAGSLSSGLVIGADTIVVQGNSILGKPRDRRDAEQMLAALSGRRHRVITGIALVDVDGFRTYSHAEVTSVYFRELSPKDIKTYLDTDEPYDKAGAYGIQGHAGLFVEKIEGCYFNVVGFPVVAFEKMMQMAGYDLVDFMGSR